MSDSWSYLRGSSGDAWTRLGGSGDAWERLYGPSGDAWERLISPVLEVFTEVIRRFVLLSQRALSREGILTPVFARSAVMQDGANKAARIMTTAQASASLPSGDVAAAVGFDRDVAKAGEITRTLTAEERITLTEAGAASLLEDV